MLYAPLRFRAQADDFGEAYEARIAQFQEHGAFANGEKIPTKEEYIKLFITEQFVSSEQSGIGKLLKANLPFLLTQLGISYEDVKSKKVDWATELKDLYLAPVLFDLWGLNKQVYKMDPDFADALSSMQKLEVSFSSLYHLPYSGFYLDLEDCYSFPGIHGIFVFLTPLEGKMYITQYILAEDMHFFSYYNMIAPGNKSDLIEIKMDMSD